SCSRCNEHCLHSCCDGRAFSERRDSSMTIALPAPAARRLIPFDLSWPILGLVAAVLVVLIVLPMSWLVYFSLTDKAGGFTLANFVQLFPHPVFLQPLRPTPVLAARSALISLAVAGPLRWLGARPATPPPGVLRAPVAPPLL